jgi:outer membrane protein insertion porin family
MRVLALVMALVSAAMVGVVPAARAQGAAPAGRGQETVIPIPPTPRSDVTQPVPSIEPPPNVSAFTSHFVTRVTAVLDGNVWDDVEAPPVSTPKPGDVLTPSAARDALRELLRTGRFARGHVSVQADGAGVAVLVHVVPRKLVARMEVDLHGATIERDDLLRDAGLVEGGEIVGVDIDATTARMERFFGVHGYPAAKARIQTRDTDDPARALVLVDVTPGAPRVIAERRFDVTGAETDQASRAAHAYAVDAGDRADETLIAAADTTLEQDLRSKGWHRAVVAHDLAWVGHPPAGGRIALLVHVDAGPRFFARFEGNEQYDDDVLRSALALESETDRSPSHLADKIHAFYEKRGFLDAQVRSEMRGDAGAPIQLIVFHIEEHERVRVAGRRYPCLRLDAIHNLHAGAPRSPGDVGGEIDATLAEELPGADLLVSPDPRGVDATIGGAGGPSATPPPVPIDLHPDTTFVPGTYGRAIEHVQELYRSEGFIHAQVGPVQVVRARCDPRSPATGCVPLPLPPAPSDECTYDPSGLPVASEPLGPAFGCHPDAARGVACAPTVDLVIPIKLGPRTTLFDIAFVGDRTVNERELAVAADVQLGDPVSTTKLEEARRRLSDLYKERGYYYADVKYALEPSPDNTRARVRFDVSEGDQVIVHDIVLRGLVKTREGVVRRRIALEVGQPYRASAVRHTQERIATLGVFSSVTVSLSEPYVPQGTKDVIIDVIERPGHYLEMSPGFSTGEGVRGTLEYDERNIAGDAIGAVFRTQLSYLPDFLILDPAVAANYATVHDRLARRITASGTFPDIGLGPLVRAQLDAVYVRDLERDFTLDKISGIASLIYRPSRTFQISIGQSVENNDVLLFGFNSVAQYLCNQTMSTGTFDSALASLLRVPDGESLVAAQRASVAWDRRDSSFNAHAGTYVFLGAELVNSYPEGSAVTADVTTTHVTTHETLANSPNTTSMCPVQDAPQAVAHFVRLSQTFAGYIPITKNISFAAELRLGENLRTAACEFRDVNPDNPAPSYCTYPDRLFFMGGFDSMRGWLQDTFMPQEYVDQIKQQPSLCTQSSTSCYIPIRGGNLMVNPRFELRFPVISPLDAAVFADFGNLYLDPGYIFHNPFSMRADVGAGIRVQTPVGPIVLDYGINVHPLPFEDFGAFHFAIGLF